jgi:hypothetical protein
VSDDLGGFLAGGWQVRRETLPLRHSDSGRYVHVVGLLEVLVLIVIVALPLIALGLVVWRLGRR